MSRYVAVTRGDHDSAQIRSDRDYDLRRKRRGELFPCNSLVILINARWYFFFFFPLFLLLMNRSFLHSIIVEICHEHK